MYLLDLNLTEFVKYVKLWGKKKQDLRMTVTSVSSKSVSFNIFEQGTSAYFESFKNLKSLKVPSIFKYLNYSESSEDQLEKGRS